MSSDLGGQNPDSSGGAYRPPDADLGGGPGFGGGNIELADRSTRLGAAVIDGLVALLVALPMLIAVAMAGGEELDFENMSMVLPLITAALFFVLFGYQLYLLSQNGWTIGKKALGIRIVHDNGSGTSMGLGRIAGLRMLVPGLIGALPIVGSVFSLVDPLFIFTESRKCLHDHIAGSVVIKA